MCIQRWYRMLGSPRANGNEEIKLMAKKRNINLQTLFICQRNRKQWPQLVEWWIRLKNIFI